MKSLLQFQRCLGRALAVAATLFLSHGPVPPASAADLIVSTLADSGPGSLRDQILASAPGDAIRFSVAGNIVLGSPLVLGKPLAVLGPGPGKLIISANHLNRAFLAGGGAILLAGLTIRDGFVEGAAGVDGLLTENGTPGDTAMGGGIWHTSGELILSNCWFAENSVVGGRGGRGGDSCLVGVCYLPPGQGGAGGMARGAAVYSTDRVKAINCTFSENICQGGCGGAGGNNQNWFAGGAGGNGGWAMGGGLNVNASTYCVFTNCTFSRNVGRGGQGGNGGTGGGYAGGLAGGGGLGSCGGLAFYGGQICSGTIVSNFAIGGLGGAGGAGTPPGTDGAMGSGQGGGVCTYLMFCGLGLANTLIADDGASESSPTAMANITDHGYNYLGDNEGVLSCGWASTTRIGTIGARLHPLLGPLALNGAGLPTHLPLPGSPVLDKGYSFGLAKDERGAPRPVDDPGVPNAAGGDGTDIGAAEAGGVVGVAGITWNRPPAGPPLVQLQVLTEAGWSYRIEFSESLPSGPANWHALLENLVGTGEAMPVFDQTPASASRFYRVLQLRPPGQ